MRQNIPITIDPNAKVVDARKVYEAFRQLWQKVSDAETALDNANKQIAALQSHNDPMFGKAITTSYSTVEWDDVIEVDTTIGDVIITLNARKLNSIVCVKMVGGSHSVIIDGNGYKIDGSSTYTISTVLDSVMLFWNGSNWAVISASYNAGGIVVPSVIVNFIRFIPMAAPPAHVLNATEAFVLASDKTTVRLQKDAGTTMIAEGLI